MFIFVISSSISSNRFFINSSILQKHSDYFVSLYICQRVSAHWSGSLFIFVILELTLDWAVVKLTVFKSLCFCVIQKLFTLTVYKKVYKLAFDFWSKTTTYNLYDLKKLIII